MYTVDNIVESALRTSGDELSILIINEGFDDYIERLTDGSYHNFYLVEDIYKEKQWTSKSFPVNLKMQKRIQEIGIKNFDLIIVFNRAAAYSRATELSRTWHIPLIVIDHASSATKAPVPFFANINIENPEAMFNHNGIVSVGVTDQVTKSWHSPSQGFGISIPVPAKKYNVNIMANSQILIDSDLPEAYIKSLSIDINPRLFTVKPEEATIYLHLWKNVTPLMIDCMASGIPVVTFQSPDFADIINSQSCVLIEDITPVDKPSFLEEIKEFNKLPTIIENAKKQVASHTKEDFNTTWSQVLEYVSNNFYMRG